MKTNAEVIKVDVSLIISGFFAFLTFGNLVVALTVVPYFKEPLFYSVYILNSMILLFAYSRLKPTYWSFHHDKDASLYIKFIGILSSLLILSVYVAQGMPSLIDFRTSNHHSLGIIWLLLNVCLLISPLGNVKKSYFYIAVTLVGVLLTGSRLYLLIYMVLTMLVFGVKLKSIKTVIVLSMTVLLSTILAVLRESGGGVNRDAIIFFLFELIERNVSLLNGIMLNYKHCANSLEYSNPIGLLIPRVLYSDKELVFNIRAFMCFYDKKFVPSKSSGFFMSEYFLYFGTWGGAILSCIIALIYSFLLVKLFNRLSYKFKLICFPLLFLGIFGPIEGLYTASFQIGLMLFVIFVIYELMPKNEGYSVSSS
ncbi:hypothetical protein [Pseudoalteromonas luteoviolacea]|uniref:Oligosaccharide repeat unit polymerase n=1 Tax=Pseudoalteromonas luteoviolacea NCIMB 1942 TaxID=1365253 RepID=A0A166ZIV8_9GAMM|nr:hypothetical protein [Pseudoalteromonas luteoviolacea]KZN44359.1 hypothetical protein N482_16460 [Pseudoalteromonas luteoviolacea NCIMB 1942]